MSCLHSSRCFNSVGDELCDKEGCLRVCAAVEGTRTRTADLRICLKLLDKYLMQWQQSVGAKGGAADRSETTGRKTHTIVSEK